MGKELTIAQAAERFALSKNEILNLVDENKLITFIHGGETYLNEKSLDVLAELTEEKSVSKVRRKMLGALGHAVVGTLGGVGTYGATKVFEGFYKEPTDIELQDLFPFWDSIQLHAGESHRVLGFHPDVEKAAGDLASFLPGERICVPLSQCPQINEAGNILQIGGPISNALSQRVHQQFYEDKKISILPLKPTAYKYKYYFPIAKTEDKPYKRYVRGKLITTLDKGIQFFDSALNKHQTYRAETKDGLITRDLLLITIGPNNLSGQLYPTTVIDVGDLYGQGDKMFAQILSDQNHRELLKKELLDKKGLYKQALYVVDVEHDHEQKITYPTNARLLDTFCAIA